jgi:GEVED domain/Bacterial Ig domain
LLLYTVKILAKLRTGIEGAITRMSCSGWFCRGRGLAALGFLLLFATGGPALADTVTLQAQKAAYAADGGSALHPVSDGQFDSVFTGANVYVWKQYLSGIQTEYRTGVDFLLPPEVMQPGTTINSAKIRATVTSETVATADSIVVHAIPGSDAPFVTTDFQVVNPVASLPIQTSASWPTYPPWPVYHDFDVALPIQGLVGNSNSHASFTFSIANWGTLLAWGSGLSLILDYTPPSGSPPTLNITGPANGTTVLQGVPVTFEATAYDAEDGPLDAAIQWTSNKNGPIGSGGTFSTSALSVGSHVITAIVKDSSGNTVAKTISLAVKPTTNTPPTITVLAPTEGATFVKGTAITFQAIASDAEDGDRTATIQWTSNINGLIGTGGSFSTSALSVGAHQIIATAYDTAGGSGSYLVNIVVQAPVNTAPVVNITSPANGASITAGTSFTLSGTANDAEQGNMSSGLQWILDGTTTIATGANANVVISSPGAHTITARVTDSGGLQGSQMVNVSVLSAPPPPATYCSLSGSMTNFEWIAAVASAGVSNVSGNNGGYRDYTAWQFNMTSGSGNSIVLTPGFSGGPYTEHWYVWVDLNRDNTFSANELLLSTSSSSALSTILTIPAGTAPGPTRMRVALSYGAIPQPCGSFQYGEVEDYTLNIQSQTTPPPPSGATYCSSRGTSTTYEWIQQVLIDGTLRPSGNNSGYADFTASAAIPLVRGVNTLTLTPGFLNASYNEQWMVWIDFNKDGVFGNEDWMFGGGGTSTVTGSFNVPTTALSGITRMRIQMKYPSASIPCETFASGEVEDYSVQIP